MQSCTDINHDYIIKNEFPHDPNAFTQGLIFDNGFLYESTGLSGQSSLRKVDLISGKVLKSRKLKAPLFGEGLTVCGDKLIQLTWKAEKGFVYDKSTFRLIKTFNYEGEGWGLTFDGKRLIMSNGKSELMFLDPETFQEIKRIKVHDFSGPVVYLNELEYVNGEIFANIWRSERIARINIETGEVNSWINLDGIMGPNPLPGVPNGIAYDSANNRLFVTGKNWPRLFEIEIDL